MRVSRAFPSHSRSVTVCRVCRSRFSSRHDAPSEPAKPSARWLSQTKERIGKCIIFGIDAQQTQRAGTVLRALGEEWRDLVAGREGFLTDRKRAGLLRHRVAWGEMDSMVRLFAGDAHQAEHLG
jgi:hypothetical protein